MLPPEKKILFDNLWSKCCCPGCGKPNVLKTFNGCGFKTMSAAGEESRILYNVASYFNHSCYPKVVTESSCVRTNTGNIKVLAYRAIPAGEEITIDCCMIKGTTFKRRQVLKEKHGFTCSCKVCLSNKTVTTEMAQEKAAALSIPWPPSQRVEGGGSFQDYQNSIAERQLIEGVKNDIEDGAGSDQSFREHFQTTGAAASGKWKEAAKAMLSSFLDEVERKFEGFPDVSELLRNRRDLVEHRTSRISEFRTTAEEAAVRLNKILRDAYLA